MKKRLKYKTRKRMQIAALLAAYAIIALSPFGYPTTLATIDHLDNLLRGKYGFTIESKVEHFLENIDENLMSRFETDGGSIVLSNTDVITMEEIESRGAKSDNAEIVNKNGGAVGTYSYKEQMIRIANKANNRTLYHEFGHYIDRAIGVKAFGKKCSKTEAFLDITETEIRDFNKKMHAYDRSDYSLESYELTQDAGEYFAESFACYLMSPRYLKHVAPETFAYMDMLYNEIR